MDLGADYPGDKVFHVEDNYIHDVGGKILNDFGAIYVAAGWNCDSANLAELKQHCYTHAHIYNNWIENVDAYFNGAVHVYTDTSSSGTVIENNVLRGQGMEALYHHCGLDNESVNNIIHRTTDPHSFHAVTAGCEMTGMEFQRSIISTALQYSVQCTVYSVQCTVYSVQSVLSIVYRVY
jgi:hypothetical protein